MEKVLPRAKRAALQSRGWTSVNSAAADAESFKRNLLALAATLGTATRTRRRSVVDALVPDSSLYAGLPLDQVSRVHILRSSSPNATISLPPSASGLQLQL